MPFPIRADGGSEFKAGFEPFEPPEPDGHVGRNNGPRRYGPDATGGLPDDDLNRWTDAFADGSDTFRPRNALGGHAPAGHLPSLTAEETPPSHMW